MNYANDPGDDYTVSSNEPLSGPVGDVLAGLLAALFFLSAICATLIPIAVLALLVKWVLS